MYFNPSSIISIGFSFGFFFFYFFTLLDALFFGKGVGVFVGIVFSFLSLGYLAVNLRWLIKSGF